MASGQCRAARVIDWAALRALAPEDIADLTFYRIDLNLSKLIETFIAAPGSA
jgi:hypothetical protein